MKYRIYSNISLIFYPNVKAVKNRVGLRIENGQIRWMRKIEHEPRRYYVPKRVIFVILGFFGMFNVHALRVNLSVAIVAMVNNTGTESGNTSYVEDSCPDLRKEDNGVTIARQTKGEQYNWDAQTKGMVISSFFYAYFITVLTGGYLAKKFGAKRIYGGGIILTSVLTLLTPITVRWGIVPFVVIRALEGIGEVRKKIIIYFYKDKLHHFLHEIKL
ncbi:UNVERIFIED_CONTAM: Sialin [Trichonephila clavipes]